VSGNFTRDTSFLLVISAGIQSTWSPPCLLIRVLLVFKIHEVLHKQKTSFQVSNKSHSDFVECEIAYRCCSLVSHKWASASFEQENSTLISPLCLREYEFDLTQCVTNPLKCTYQMTFKFFEAFKQEARVCLTDDRPRYWEMDSRRRNR